MQKLVYSFNEGSKDMKNLLGDKGANLAEMTKIGLRVPFGFIVTTDACKAYHADGGELCEDLKTEIADQLEVLENVTGKKFGDRENPLLVSVRSGAPVSMPGMMDTVLNLGLNDETTEGLAALTGNPDFAYDSYRRFIQMFGEVVLGISKDRFDVLFEQQKDVDVKTAIAAYKALIVEESGKRLPQNSKEQLVEAVAAAFRYWNSEPAVLYRQMHGIPEDMGTAVSVQAMVFGNMGDTSASGRAFSRNPVNGRKEPFGEFLLNSQGEALADGTGASIQMSRLEAYFPDAYRDFQRIAEVLEKHYKDMQLMEFTIENNKLYILQTKTAKRTAECAVYAAVDMVEEGLISKETAVARMDVGQIEQLMHPSFEHEAEARAKILAKGLPASPGAASGRIFFDAKDAVCAAEKGIKSILVCQETSPEDLAGMAVAEGILTVKGGMTSYAAVVARGMGKCCITGCSEIQVDEAAKTLTLGDIVLDEGDSISLNGTLGHVYFGEVKNTETAFSEEFNQIMAWADEIRTLKVRTNADKPADARQALLFGAEGIGLCRTEHMFFEEGRIPLIRQMILAASKEARKEALDKLLPLQKGDFKEIYEVMEDLPVTIRLLDPPLHEFLPQTEEDTRALSEQTGIPYEDLARRAEELEEFNPMLGHRGCRLAITYPEIAAMQTRAIMEAAIEVSKEKNIVIVPEIMIPLASMDTELAEVKKTVIQVAEDCKKAYEAEMDYFIGTMIEVPRAALTAGEIAKEAEFFSFGTNDLTQMVYGLSRDDTGNIIGDYIEKGILKEDPFQTIDQKGVGRLMELAVKQGKQARANLKLGICGEHGGDPKSIAFCHHIGLHYVSCSPYRVPAARLAAAQAAINYEE